MDKYRIMSKINKPDDCKVFFTRHAQSMANVSDYKYTDSPLSSKGIKQAQKLQGHFDLVVISPLRRCMETLLCSGITYDNVVINKNLREHIDCSGNVLPNEEFKQNETNESFWGGSISSHMSLMDIVKSIKKS